MASTSRQSDGNIALHATSQGHDSQGLDSQGLDSQGLDSQGHDSQTSMVSHNSSVTKNGTAKNGTAKNGADKNGGARVVVEDGPLEQLVTEAQQGDDALRNRMIQRLRPMVRAMARTMALRLPSCVDPEDLEHAGLWGVMQSLDRFDPNQGAAFLPFMRIRVRGAMLDELRTLDVLPRPTRQRLRQREDALARLRAELAREPSHDELAEALGTTPAVLDRDQQLAAPWVIPGASDSANGDPVDAMPDEGAESPLDVLDRQDLMDRIEHLLRPVEWQVVRMLYLEGLTGKDVAAELDLSAARVCQIHQRVLGRLKERLASVAGDAEG